jgi:hypothetical protein
MWQWSFAVDVESAETFEGGMVLARPSSSGSHSAFVLGWWLML